MSKPKQIVALGGGGFSMESSLLLDHYLLAATGQPRPQIAFIPTASGDSEYYLSRFYDTFSRLDCRPSHLSMFKPHTADFDEYLQHQHLIFVGGGNTRSMLALWREWGLDKALRRAYEAGVVLSGISAGMICWFEWGLTDSNPGQLVPLNCLGLLPGGACPHYDGESKRQPALQLAVAHGSSAAYAADDGAALHFVEGTLHQVVSSRPSAKAYLVEKASNGGSQTTALETQFLGV
ncbi:Type 1 glutamine amidotransferase-like domain-containing protein [Parachitinimonas caeni]|uniref:Peptidase E n=1 Tax=Parachitinimonas caeni TaxID=3031301 RepID=A0ABT7DXI3_9NEIS|nr:peptidase E [Parachitinimonas caeni]MDK2124773.1 peptidase E [Parachitinimonas caeni]